MRICRYLRRNIESGQWSLRSDYSGKHAYFRVEVSSTVDEEGWMEGVFAMTSDVMRPENFESTAKEEGCIARGVPSIILN